MDVSGIQDFIYTIQSKDALKMLRARSFYLEIMMEHMIDTLLTRLHLSRANLIYAGGGHSYLLLPNTKTVIDEIKRYEKDMNEWFLQQFDVALYVAVGYAEATANTLQNIPEESYAGLYHSVSDMISRKKRSRYGAEDIKKLNKKQPITYGQECLVCKKLEEVGEDGLCHICAGLRDASNDILFQQFFVVVNKYEEHSLPLPENCYLIAASEKDVRERMKQSDSFVRVYGKNEYYTGSYLASKVWVGDYTKGQTFEELADSSKGIHRIGVLRADVDNLGQTFVGGFKRQYNTLSRTAALSRQLSLFFKYYINGILKQGQYHIDEFCQDGKTGRKRNATIIYSGGDDVFIVGAWNEVIELAVDIQSALARYTENTLTISAGIGIYDSKYPISCIANEVGKLEDISKKMKGKASITLLPAGSHEEENDEGKMVTVSDGTYHWDSFVNKVVKSKYACLKGFFAQSEDRGKSFLYHLLALIRGQKDRINFARYVYLLARMEPDIHAIDEKIDEKRAEYRKFSRQMYDWIQNEEDCRQLCTAINLYAYLVRIEKEGKEWS